MHASNQQTDGRGATAAPAPGCSERIARMAARLPCVDVSIAELIGTLASEYSSAADVSRTLSRDISLAARVLKVVNSAYYGQPRTISSIERAVVVLGLPTIRGIALAASCYRMPSLPSVKSGFTASSVLTHCLGVAIAARLLASGHPRLAPEDAFMAGLLHDFGLLLELYGEFEMLCGLVAEVSAGRGGVGPRGWMQLERETFGADHGVIAAEVLAGWRLPDDIVKAIRHHHEPMQQPSSGRALASVVALADSLVCDLGAGLQFNSEPSVPDVELLSSLNYQWDRREALQQQVAAELGRLQGESAGGH